MSQLAKLIARQSSRPRGIVGRVWGPLLDRSTRTANHYAFDALALERDLDVLEVGFGGGRLLSRVLAATDGRVAGIEVSDVMISRAQRRFGRHVEAGRLRLAQADVAAMPFDDGSFDRVVSVHTIYFWADVAAGLREIARVLRPNGTLVLGTATKEFLSRRRASEHGYRLFTEAELQDALARAGFADVTMDRHETAVVSRGTRPARRP